MKKAMDTYARVIVCSELIYNIQKFGNCSVVSLKLDEYCALLVYAYPHGTAKKARNRAVGLEKASELESIRTALRKYVAGVSVPIAFSRSRGASAPPHTHT
jgi:hypothetical protein